MQPTTRFIIVSLLFHLLYTASIFDIYFTSPVVHPARRFSPLNAAAVGLHDDTSVKAPADRLVLIVGDGLRADTLFKHHTPDVLPAWAAHDLLQGQRVSTANTLNTAKSWTKDAETLAKTAAIGSFDAAPFLRRAATVLGTWGVSHTRVPTESRPGHVALIAGMYEDVSAVTKGWKLNPVSFDSVFNQSSHTFSFGSPDILPMFAIGATPGKVDAESYAEEAEDFTADASNLDLWVLNRLKALFDNAANNVTLDAQLRAPQTVFFLHLLGLDTTGHTYRPQSAEYVGNLMVVDAIVAQTEKLFDEFYGKEANANTAFVFTADHGMSNKGNHGDGEPDNTRTPLVAWGAGIHPPRRVGQGEQAWRQAERESDSYYQDWGSLDSYWRNDVQQADITTLMSTLIGVNVPANSEGKLPRAYLNADRAYTARAIFANALETLEVYRVKHEQRRVRSIRYKPFKHLHSQDGRPPGQEVVDKIQESLSAGDFAAVENACEKLISDALQGAQYLQTYDWLMLVGIIVSGYIGSMLYSATFLLRQYVLPAEKLQAHDARRARISLGRFIVTATLAALWAKFAAEKSPWTYYMYAGFASYYWIRVSDESHTLSLAWSSAIAHYKNVQQSARPGLSLILSVVIRFVGALIALEVMVVGYVHRLAWSAGFVFIGFLWPAFGLFPDVKNRHEPLLIVWFFLCGFCSLFTLGNVEKQESILFLILSGLVFLLAGLVVTRVRRILFSANTPAQQKHSQRTRNVLSMQLAVLVVATIVTASSSSSLQQKKGLPRVNQVIAWLVLAICITVPFLYGFRSSSTVSTSAGKANAEAQVPSQRLAIIVFAFAPLFVLLSIRDETLFFGCYTLTLISWAKLEASLFEERLYLRNVQRVHGERQNGVITNGTDGTGRDKDDKDTPPRTLEKEDVRVALFFLFFLHVGFFGTGNVASISSFYLSPVYRLVPIFSPFLMAALLLLKILVPFVVLASVLQTLCLTPAHRARTNGRIVRKTGAQLAGPPLFGQDAVGGLMMRDAYALTLLACLFTDVLALNFLLRVKTQGSWLEIGQTITHFAMANLLQVFMLALGAVADAIVGRGLAVQ